MILTKFLRQKQSNFSESRFRLTEDRGDRFLSLLRRSVGSGKRALLADRENSVAVSVRAVLGKMAVPGKWLGKVVVLEKVVVFEKW